MIARQYSILVLHDAQPEDARPDELDGIVQAEQVAEAIKKLGWRVRLQPVGLNLHATLAGIRKKKPSCVFNLVESPGGDGRLIHFVPALLDVAGIPYTGCGSDAIYLTSQKQLGKSLMEQNGIPTPRDLRAGSPGDDAHSTWIIKSLWEDASFGLDDGCVVKGSNAALQRIADCESRFGGEWFAEEYLDGREFNISVLEHKGQPWILPMAEMTFVGFPDNKPHIVGYAAKWDEAAPEYSATRREFPELPDALRDRLEDIVRHCWTLFGLRGYARVDLRLDAAGEPRVLEVNANPCLSRDAGFAAAAAEAGIAYEQLVDRIVRSAIRPALRVFRRSA